jgi:hypothetical protein
MLHLLSGDTEIAQATKSRMEKKGRVLVSHAL